jgi:hypothetical protein
LTVPLDYEFCAVEFRQKNGFPGRIRGSAARKIAIEPESHRVPGTSATAGLRLTQGEARIVDHHG